jgi:hypothetical protein
MIKLNLEKLSLIELLESYFLLIKIRSKDIDEIHQYANQIVKTGTANELKILEVCLSLDDPLRKEITDTKKRIDRNQQ